MRLSVAFLSVCTTSASNRRPSFCYGLAASLISNYERVSFTRPRTSSTSHARIRAMELGQSKRPRNAEETSPDPDADYVEIIMKQRSPYERKTGRMISSCPKCHGEGKIRGPLSKKARALKMQSNSNGSGDATSCQTSRFTPPTKPCRVCDGSGLIAAHPLSASTDVQRQTTKEDDAGMILPLSVAIVGGGIGGIALAAALQHRNIPCVVYERDTSFEERKQGYGLTMQQGARALRSLGFFSPSDDDDDDDDDDDGESDVGIGIHSTRHVVHKPCGTVVGEWGMRVWGGRFEKNGRKHARRQNAHISRQNLRGMLLDMLRPGTVRWGHMLTGYSRRVDSGDDDSGNDNLKLNLTFQRRGPECQAGGEECDDVFTTSATVLVGCDGIRSAVRAKKLGEDVAPLRYLGCCVVLGIAASPDSSLTDGETVFQTADGVTRLYAMPFAQAGEDVSTIAGGTLSRPSEHRGLSMWQLSFPMQEAESKKLSELGPSALKAEALKRCGQWHDPIPALLSQTPEDLITGYPCYDRATVEKDFFRAGCNAPETAAADPFVTMLGDAAHPMSPFKGQGANQALLDAVLLARKLVSIDKRKPKERSLDDGIPAALAEFEKEMLTRSAVKVAKSADAAEFLHSHVAISEGNVTRGGAAVGGAGKR